MSGVVGKLAEVEKLTGNLTPQPTLQGTLAASESLSGTLSSAQSLTGNLAGADTLEGTLAPMTGDVPAYAGPYEVTPSAEKQTLRTAGRLPSGDIVVNPIPSNYGLITWNGSVLTVS